MKNLSYWEKLGVKNGVMPIQTYLDDVNKCIEALSSNIIFEGRNANFSGGETRRLIQTALIHCGYIPIPPVASTTTYFTILRCCVGFFYEDEDRPALHQQGHPSSGLAP